MKPRNMVFKFDFGTIKFDYTSGDDDWIVNLNSKYFSNLNEQELYELEVEISESLDWGVYIEDFKNKKEVEKAILEKVEIYKKELNF